MSCRVHSQVNSLQNREGQTRQAILIFFTFTFLLVVLYARKLDYDLVQSISLILNLVKDCEICLDCTLQLQGK